MDTSREFTPLAASYLNILSPMASCINVLSTSCLLYTSMEIRVNAGYAFIKGYAFRNPATLSVTLDTAEGALNLSLIHISKQRARVSSLTRRTLRHLLQQERKITCGKQTLWEQRKAQRLKRGLQQCRKRQQQWKVYKTGKERGVAWAAP